MMVVLALVILAALVCSAVAKPVSTPQIGMEHKRMSIKLIAADKGRHFSERSKTYNRDRFMAYQHIAAGIRFVVASGNQYYQLISFFRKFAHEIAFVAENGGWVVRAKRGYF